MLKRNGAPVVIDCHCHLSAPEFNRDLDDVVEKTREAGVKALLAVTEGVDEFERVMQLAKIYPDLVFPCLGIHPIQGSGQDRHSVKIQDLEASLPYFQRYGGAVVAVGEIGLDFTPWFAPTAAHRDEQLLVFGRQLDISKQLDLPVNVHSRSAAKVTIATMREHGIGHALLHNFAGRWSVAMEALRAGYYVSFPPAVSVNDQRAKLIRQIPLEHICLETDAPALGPDKHVRNEPRNITLACDYIARVKGVPPELVAEITTQNALTLFPRVQRALDV